MVYVLLCSGGGVLVYTDSSPLKRILHADATLDADGQPIRKKKVVVLGSGWSGYSFLNYLNNPNYDVQVVSPRNFFLFTPLLPSVTNGTVEARSIVEPIRGLMRKVTTLFYLTLAISLIIIIQVFSFLSDSVLNHLRKDLSTKKQSVSRLMHQIRKSTAGPRMGQVLRVQLSLIWIMTF